MSSITWRGVMPAITTPFQEDGQVDHEFLAGHARRLLQAGATGIVPLGSLGEGATLDFEEKCAVMKTLVLAVGESIPIVPGIAALSTDQAVELSRAAEAAGCLGLMVLPPYVYVGSEAEMEEHVARVIDSTALDVMLYNNPIAYGVDFKPHRIAAMAERHPRLNAVKDSSGDVRRITAIRGLCADRLQVFVGLDDYVVEGVRAGAEGWIAGLVNALPEESIKVFDLARSGDDDEELRRLYDWFLPLLRLDTVPTFVQLIKLVQARVDLGSERVRPPRLELAGGERECALAVIEEALEKRPAI